MQSSGLHGPIFFHAKVFIVADKCDRHCLRAATLPNSRTAADEPPATANTTFIISTIPDICGPDALRQADKLLRGEALGFCAPNHDQIPMHTKFWECLRDEKLFGTEAICTA
ncbi:hypothetical protein D6C82_02717 [Aureobasidium pullulans]|nr:hypothetical protein D6C82_02717 [Aureobasidium pullulans]